MRNLTPGHLRSPWCAPELVEQTKHVFFPRCTTSHLFTLSRVVSAARTAVLPPSGLKEVMPVFWKLNSLVASFAFHLQGATLPFPRPRSSALELASLAWRVGACGQSWGTVNSQALLICVSLSGSLEVMICTQGRVLEVNEKFPKSKLSHLKVT